MVASGPRMTGSGVIIAPAVFSTYDIRRRTSSASSGSISSRRASAVSGAGPRSGPPRRRATSPRARRRRARSRGWLRISTWSSSGSLLQDVGEPLVVERGHDRGPPLDGEVVDHAGRVGRPHLVERVHEVGGALGLLATAEPLDVAPLDDVGLAPRRRSPLAGSWTATRLRTQSRLRACSIATSYTTPTMPLLEMRHGAVEHLADHQGLGRALLEAAHVEQPGRVDLPGVDVGDPGHRHEDPSPSEHLGHQPEDPWLAAPPSGSPPPGRGPCRPGRPAGRRSAGRPGGLRRPAQGWCSHRDGLACRSLARLDVLSLTLIRSKALRILAGVVTPRHPPRESSSCICSAAPSY